MYEPEGRISISPFSIATYPALMGALQPILAIFRGRVHPGQVVSLLHDQRREPTLHTQTRTYGKLT